MSDSGIGQAAPRAWSTEQDDLGLRPPGQPERFSVGPVSFLVDAADVRNLCWAGQEIVRRIFVTVRDNQWREVSPTAWSCRSILNEGSLRVHLTARHEDPQIRFAWRGCFMVDPTTREMSFSLAGKVLDDMEVNRLGLVVLHPLDALLGGSITVSGPTGVETLAIREQIHPQPMVDGLPTGMTIPFHTQVAHLSNGDSLRFNFSGELFEIEDQRNFGDASFKSYCPPLAAGFPRLLQAGTRVTHEVRCVASVAGNETTVSGHSDALVLPALRRVYGPPPVGIHEPAMGDAASTGLLASAYFRHLRADVAADASVDSFTTVCAQLAGGQGLELGLVVGPDDEVADELIAAICAERRLTRLLLVEEGPSVIRREVAERVCAALHRRGCGVPVFTAVDGYFVDVNRGVVVETVGDGMAIAVCPSVHSGDVLTVTENVAALPYVVSTAQDLFPGRDIAVSPLTLRLGPPPEPEVYELAALAWFVAALETLGRTTVSSVTIGSDVLPPPPGQAGLGEAWASVLDLLGQAREAAKVGSCVVGESRVHALGWGDADYEQIIVANLADQDQVVRVDGEQAPARTRVIWAPSKTSATTTCSSDAFVVPAYGVVHLKVRQ